MLNRLKQRKIISNKLVANQAVYCYAVILLNDYTSSDCPTIIDLTGLDDYSFQDKNATLKRLKEMRRLYPNKTYKLIRFKVLTN